MIYYQTLDQEVLSKSFLHHHLGHHGTHPMKTLSISVLEKEYYLLCLYFQMKITHPVHGEYFLCSLFLRLNFLQFQNELKHENQLSRVESPANHRYQKSTLRIDWCFRVDSFW
jgi:hypothetical protein